jgi:PAS domain S-box-containing protein
MRTPFPTVPADPAATPPECDTPDAHSQVAYVQRALDLVFRNGPVAMALIDTQGHVVHANRAYERLFGWSSAELGRMTPVDYTHPDDCEVGVAEVLALLRGEVDSAAFEKRYRTRTGGEIRGRVMAFAVRDEAGRLVYVVSTVRDVTEERAAQRRAEDWQRRYETAIRASRQALYDWDLVTRDVVWAGACEAILGYSPAELGGVEDWLARIHPDDRAAFLATTDRGLADLADTQLVYRVQRRDGAWIWVEDSSYVVANAAGVAERMTGFVVDVTDRVRAEQEQNRQAERFRIAAAVMNGFVWDWHLESGEVWRSDGVRGLVGYTPGELGPGIRQWHARVHPDDRARVELSPPPESFEIEYRVRHRDGRWIIVWDRGVARRDEHGRIVRLVGAAVDITDRYHSAEEIRRLNADLERRVAERTGELVRTNRELEAFTYSVSHDLRAPLRHVAGFAELLRQRAGGSLDAESQRYLGLVLDASARMGELLDRLLDLSHLGRAPLGLQRVDPTLLVRELVAEFAPQHAHRDIVWRIGAVPPVRADPSLLRLVLSNLLHNAIKYSAVRSPAAIEVRGRARDDGMVEFEIEDNGVGFDMRYADRLFGVFERLHPADEYAGWGVGLASVQRIVARHGGTVSGHGEPGRGATFTVTLPSAGTPP